MHHMHKWNDRLSRPTTRFVVVETEQLAALFAECSNAGRWGPDDELGTLNLITPATRRRAAQLVVEGLSVSMASDLSVQHTPSTDSLDSHAAFTDPAAPIAVADAITLQVHGWSTHLDALGHIYTDGVGYNGRRRAEIFTGHGLAANAITAMKDGVFTRGVLLDVAARGGVPWLPADHVITRAELERAEDAAGVRVEAGDALFVHTGLSARLAADTHPTTQTAEPVSGSTPCCGCGNATWRCSGVTASSCCPGPTPTFPSRSTSSASARWDSRCWTGRASTVSSRCALSSSRREFLLTVAPLPIVGGTGSPVNPIATF